ncbi:MAG: hypothetical protein R3B90_08600 [Planctomycetaceae bacterium]
MDSQLRDELLHDATQAELALEMSQKTPTYSIVLNRIRERFPDSATPRDNIPEEVRTGYLGRPRQFYAEADEETRPLLERLLFVETAMLKARAELRPDGSNGDLVAKSLIALVPERQELAESLREQELAYHEGRVARMSRVEVVEFQKRLDALELPERGRRAVENWIEAQYVGRQRSPELDIDRAEKTLDLLGDKEAVLALVTRAMKVDPRIDGSQLLLERMGYGWLDGKAVPLDQMPRTRLTLSYWRFNRGDWSRA